VERPAAHAYIVVETSALVQRRLGMTAVERLHRGLLPVVGIHMVDLSTHQRAVERWVTERLRRLSLVDVTSFVVMRDRGLEQAFAYDDDFAREGFSLWE
jgi:predicted nucleic acid-binding protein